GRRRPGCATTVCEGNFAMKAHSASRWDEFRNLREQMKSDFEWTVSALCDVRDRMTEVADRMGHLERRFESAMDILQEEVTSHDSRLDDHERRLCKLEGDPAA
ncbi:MAG: hypothetical protein AB1758_20925, partial [Candidatus Eremiobacterota bacterium]